nr:DEAD/DEAH box helicase family protein [uncultured Schaedlerella sp.]
MGQKLYQWQEECLERWFSNRGRGLVQAVTGSGKTLLALTAAARLERMLGQELHVKIVVPTGGLMRQWDRALREYLISSHGKKQPPAALRGLIGLRGGGHQASPDCRYMIYVINSARYELARQILAELRNGEAVLLIADECHHYVSGQNQLIFEFLPYIKPEETQFYSLGLSATLPSGQAQHFLASVLGRKIYSYEMSRASALRTVCKYDIYHIGLSFESDERCEYDELTDALLTLYYKLKRDQPFLDKLSQGEFYELLRAMAAGKNKEIAEAASKYMYLSYRRKSLVCQASARIACACELIKNLADHEKILIFGERISQAEELYRLLQETCPGRAGRYHSKMGDQANKNILERFRVNEIRILIACKSMDEGVDIPDATVGIILSGTSAQRQRVQRLGRIIRKKEGKNRASLYYLHITGTSEEVCFLPEAGENRLFELEYVPELQMFTHPRYDKRAARVLENMQRDGKSKEQMREARRCLRLGIVRSDWLRAPEELEEYIKKARYASEKNYWICMKKMADKKSSGE